MEQQLIEMGNRIKIRRKALNMKQSELAELLDISNNHMSSIETGKQKPSFDILIKLCQHLQITPNHLLLGCMYPDNIPQNTIDTICMCNPEQAEFLREFAELLFTKNLKNL